jgi:hypothetical protein
MLDRETAEIVAIKALAFIADEPARLERFFALTGLSPAEVKARASDPAFLGGVLDFVLSDEPLVVQFAAYAGLDARIPLMARSALPGA